MSKKVAKLNKISLAILVILAFGLVFSLAYAVQAEAADPAFYNSYNPPTPADDPSRNSNPAPAISSITPNKAEASGESLTITIIGSGFIPSSVARWNGSNRPTTFIDPSHLLVNLHQGDLYGMEAKYVSVFNPAPGGGYSNGVLFTIKNPLVTSRTSPRVSTTRSSTLTSNGEVMGEDVIFEENPYDRDFSTLASNAIYGTGGNGPSGLVQWVMLAILLLLVTIVVRKLYGEKKYHSTPLKHA